MMLRGGSNGHAEMLLSAVDYCSPAPGTLFINPTHPGIYPVYYVTNANQSQLEAEHKEEANQFQTFVGIGLGLKDLTQKAIKYEYLLELNQEWVAYLHVMPIEW